MSTTRVQAQGAAPERKPVALAIERCEGLPFDVAAYERVLIVELRVLATQPADPSSERRLSVRSPGCNEQLEVSLQMGERSASELLRASDYAGVGQPRALALATIETLRVLTARMQAAATPAPLPPAAPAAAPSELPAASSAPPATPSELPAAPAAEQPAPPAPPAAPPAEQPVVPKPAASSSPSPPEPARKPGSFELSAGAGAGLFDTLDWQAQLGGALALTQTWWLDAELAFGQASDQSALGSVDASALTLAVSLELRLWLAGPLELSFGGGLRGGAAWASADSALPLRSGAAAQDAVAPVLLAFAELGVAYEVADGLTIGLWVEPGLGIVVAHFLGTSPAAVESEDAASARQPEVDLLGPGLYGGLTLGYRF